VLLSAEEEVTLVALVVGEEIFLPQSLEVSLGEHVVGATLGDLGEADLDVIVRETHQVVDGGVFSLIDETVTGGVVGVEHELHVVLLPGGESLSSGYITDALAPHFAPFLLLDLAVLVDVSAGSESLPDFVEGGLGILESFVVGLPSVELPDLLQSLVEVDFLNHAILVCVVKVLKEVDAFFLLEFRETHFDRLVMLLAGMKKKCSYSARFSRLRAIQVKGNNQKKQFNSNQVT